MSGTLFLSVHNEIWQLLVSPNLVNVGLRTCVIPRLMHLLSLTTLRVSRIDDAKCILVRRVCVSVCLFLAAFQHYFTDPDVTWENGRRCPLWAFSLCTLGQIFNQCTGFVATET